MSRLRRVPQRGWWCPLCNREWLDEDTAHFVFRSGMPECPDCYTPMKRVVR